MRRGFTWIELLVVIVIVLIIFVCLMPEVGIRVGFGWLMYLQRVVPRMQPAWDQVAVFAVGLVLIVVLGHVLQRRLWSERPASLGKSLRGVGLVLLVFVAGTAFVGATHQAGWLLTSKEPWITSGRYSGRGMSQHYLKQLAIGLHGHVGETEGKLPLGVVTSPQGELLHGWPTLLLPYMEQDNVYRQIDPTRPWNDPKNLEASKTFIRYYQHPALADQRVDGFPTITYAANAHVLGDRVRLLKEYPEASQSHVVLFAEVGANHRPWASPLHLRDAHLPLGHQHGFGPVQGGNVVQIATLDGSVRVFRVGEGEKEYRDFLQGKEP